MSQHEFETIITEGLLKAYAGDAKFTDIFIGGISLKQSRLQIDKADYLDQYSSAKNGGGRELVIQGNSGLIRTYVGGIPMNMDLSEIGTSEEEVIGFLITSISGLGGKTRLREDCRPSADGRFRYEYVVTDSAPEFGLTSAQENIFFDDHKVFTHWFTLGPVRI